MSGFDQGGLLTEAIMRTPHAVLVLDEIEKAHPNLFNLLLQVMDSATLTDNNGKKADFRNVILIMTTNAGARELSSGGVGFRNSVRHKGQCERRDRANVYAGVSQSSRRVGAVQGRSTSR